MLKLNRELINLKKLVVSVSHRLKEENHTKKRHKFLLTLTITNAIISGANNLTMRLGPRFDNHSIKTYG